MVLDHPGPVNIDDILAYVRGKAGERIKHLKDDRTLKFIQEVAILDKEVCIMIHHHSGKKPAVAPRIFF